MTDSSNWIRGVELLSDGQFGRPWILLASHNRTAVIVKSPVGFRDSLRPGTDFMVVADVVDQATDISPATIFVSAVKRTQPRTSGASGGAPVGFGLRPMNDLVQRPWTQTVAENIKAIQTIGNLPPSVLGFRTAEYARSAVRAILWTPASRLECFEKFGSLVAKKLGHLANTIGPIPVEWLSLHLSRASETITISRQRLFKPGPAVEPAHPDIEISLEADMADAMSRGGAQVPGGQSRPGSASGGRMSPSSFDAPRSIATSTDMDTLVSAVIGGDRSGSPEHGNRTGGAAKVVGASFRGMAPGDTGHEQATYPLDDNPFDDINDLSSPDDIPEFSETPPQEAVELKRKKKNKTTNVGVSVGRKKKLKGPSMRR